MSPAHPPAPSTTHPQRITVIGAGYVGLVTAACLAAMGNDVACVDASEERVRRLRGGILPVREPGLQDLVDVSSAAGRLRFSTDTKAAVRGADIVFIAVGTLDDAGNWTDRNVAAVLADVLAAPEVPPLTVIRSTLRPGRMARFAGLVAASGRVTTLLVQPEFTREGTAVADFLAPDRVVVGIPAGCDEGIAGPIRELYAPLGAPCLVVDHASAELIKIGSNAFLATKIAFANELARLCREMGADATDVRRGVGLDPRIGEQFLRAGPGFGGSCLPSQVALLSEISDELDLGLELLPAVHRSNRGQPLRIAREVLSDIGPSPAIAVLGLAFKAGTDDLRELPALALIDALAAGGAGRLTAFDPAVPAVRGRPDLRVCTNPYAAAEGADAIVIATEWPLFGALDWRRLASVMRRREVYDARGIVDVDRAVAAGFRVRSVERALALPLREEAFA